MASLEISNLVKEFGNDIIAVDDFNINIEDGEFIVIVGPSGCGKSTTLNCVAGLEDPTEGEIILGANEITDETPQNRDIAMVFQSYALYPHMSVHENISFGLRMSTDLGSDEIDKKVTEVAQLLGIEDHINKQPGDLSGGQRQRVALGRAIVREPELFLMDEPLSNLDAKLRTEMRTEISRLHDQLDVTTIYVTHDQTEAMTMADRIAVMKDGVLQQVASPLELYYAPVNRFVAEFIGDPSMNFFEVDYEPVDDANAILRNDAIEITIDRKDEIAITDESLYLGLRPEAFSLAKGEERNVIKTQVDVVEPMGDINHVHFSIADDDYVATLPGRQFPETDHVTEFSVPTESIYLFDSSGETILHPEINLETELATDVYQSV